MVYVTHDQVEAMTLADRIVVLSAGKIEQVGTPMELYEHPDNLFVAGFIGSPKMNFIEAEIVTASAEHATVRLSDGAIIRTLVDASRAKVGDKVTLGVRPEHFAVGGDANLIASTVTFVESLGGATHAYCAYPGVEDALTCEFDGRTRVRAGDTLQLHAPAELCYLFDAEGLAFTRLGAAA
jgi:multiple sugar transport system ATP-binding protein